jgi:predicted molibdopterin-dependent oxidoreductase YjgC
VSVWRDVVPLEGATIVVDGAPIPARVGEPVAAALLRAGRAAFGRHPGTGRPVGPACLMGACFGCLCTIDGRAGMRACLAPVRDGLSVDLSNPGGDG